MRWVSGQWGDGRRPVSNLLEGDILVRGQLLPEESTPETIVERLLLGKLDDDVVMGRTLSALHLCLYLALHRDLPGELSQ